MKHLLLAISGAVFAWVVLGFFMDTFDMNGLLTLIIGIFLGYSVRKQAEPKES